MGAKRKILFISSNFPPVIGGSSVVYDQLCKNAGGQVIALGAARNHQTGEAWPDLATQDPKRGYEIHRIPFLRPPEGSDRKGRFGRLIGSLVNDVPVMLHTLGCALWLIMHHRIKVVCLGELVYGGWLVFPLRYLFRRRVLIYTHGEEISQNSDSLLANSRRIFLQHANGIISVSLFCKGEIVSKYGIDPARIQVVTNGVDLATFCRGEKDRSCLPPAIRDRKIILSVSRLVERKGQEYLIRAFPRLIETIPDAHCVIVGQGPLAGKLRDTAAELGMEAYCTILGGVSLGTLVELYRCCDVFVLPCRTLPDGDTEGFGLVFLEANACGAPVVAGAAGGTIEAVVDGETGFLVDGSDPCGIAKAVISILEDPTFAHRLAEQGWQRAQRHGWQTVTQEFLRVCDADASSDVPHSYAQRPSALTMPEAAHQTASLTPNLLVTVDVEEKFDWSDFSPDRISVQGVAELRSFHQECNSIGIRPVYLMSYPVMTDPDHHRFFSQVLAENSGELGIHLHSWTTPPVWEHPNKFTSYQSNLPEHIERRKLEVLCRTFESRFGRPVKIHRAGRWGGGDRTSALLEEFGITVDLSPSTGYFNPSEGGPDFSNLDGSSFWGGPNGQILTVPASAIKFFRGPRWISTLLFSVMRNSSSIRTLAARFGKAVRFSPEDEDEAMLMDMSREFRLRNLHTVVYALHSTSLYDDGNPYSAGGGMSSALRRRSLAALTKAIEAGMVKPTTCAELQEEAKCLRNQFAAKVET